MYSRPCDHSRNSRKTSKKKKKLFDSTVIPVINLSTEALFQDLNKYAKINYMQLTLVRGMLMI